MLQLRAFFWGCLTPSSKLMMLKFGIALHYPSVVFMSMLPTASVYMTFSKAFFVIIQEVAE